MIPGERGRRRAVEPLVSAAVVTAVTAAVMFVVAVGPAQAVTVDEPVVTPEPAAGECAGTVGAADPDCDTDASLDAADGQPGAVSGWIADGVAGAVFSQLSRWVVEGARWMLARLFGAISESTAPDLTADWFADHLARMEPVAGTWLALVYLAAAIDAAVRIRGVVLLRAVAVTPVAVAGSAVAVFVLGLLTAGFDEAADWLIAAAAQDLVALGERVGLALALVVVNAPIVGLLAALAVVLAAAVVWVELLMREAALYLAASFLPLAVASAVWPVTAQWLVRLARLAVALAAWKFVIVSAVSAGAALLAHGGPERGIAALLTGLSTLLLAAFAPVVVLRIANVFDAEAVGGVQGGLTGAARRMLSPVMTAAGLGLAAHRVLDAGRGAPPGPASTSDRAAPRSPSRVPLRRPALPAGRSPGALPAGGGPTARLPSGHVDAPEGWAAPSSGAAQPVYPDPPTATVPGGWWIVGQDTPPQPGVPRPPAPRPTRPSLPAGPGAAAGLPSGHVDAPEAWAAPSSGAAQPVYPDPPTATVPGGWWIVGQDAAARPGVSNPSARPRSTSTAGGRPYPPPPLPIPPGVLGAPPPDAADES